MITLRSSGPARTRAIGRALAPHLRAGDVLALAGDLGAGKTCLVKGLADGLGLDGRSVPSPTFNVVIEHRAGRLPLYHVDLYRIADPDELVEIGLDHYLHGDGICAVEWLERFPALAPRDRLDVRIALDGPRDRSIRVAGHGDRGLALERAWDEAWRQAAAQADARADSQHSDANPDAKEEGEDE